MPLDEDMRKLQFLANCETHSHPNASNSCHITQAYVTDLLSKQLKNYGFTAEEAAEKKLQVSVEDHPVAIGVNCSVKDENGLLVCEITAHANEEQDWFSRIETQSVIKQLSQAVENTLKEDQSFSEFEWKS